MTEIINCFRLNIYDLIKNKKFTFMIVASNFIVYIGLNLVRSGDSFDIWWTCNSIYIYILSVFMPIVMYDRFSDNNRRIIDSVITTKLTNKNIYIKCYLFTVNICVSISFFCSNFILAIMKNFISSIQFEIYRNISLIISSILFVFIIEGIFTLLVYCTKRYFISYIIYICVIFVLLIINNEYLTLTFPYNYELVDVEYFLGKIVFIVTLSICILISMRSKTKYKL